MVTRDGKRRCAECHLLTTIDRTDGVTVLHWSTARTECGPQVPMAARWWE